MKVGGGGGGRLLIGFPGFSFTHFIKDNWGIPCFTWQSGEIINLWFGWYKPDLTVLLNSVVFRLLDNADVLYLSLLTHHFISVTGWGGVPQ